MLVTGNIAEMIESRVKGRKTNQGTADAIQGLRLLRNLAAHEPHSVTPAQAQRYLQNVEAMIWTLTTAK
jgi:hypothetical protein